MSQQTPLQKLLRIIKERKEYNAYEFNKHNASCSRKVFYELEKIEYDILVFMDEEREEIVNAFTAGTNDDWNNGIDYYKQKFS